MWRGRLFLLSTAIEWSLDITMISGRIWIPQFATLDWVLLLSLAVNLFWSLSLSVFIAELIFSQEQLLKSVILFSLFICIVLVFVMFSAVVPYSLHQVIVYPGNLQGILIWPFLVYTARLFSFCWPSLEKLGSTSRVERLINVAIITIKMRTIVHLKITITSRPRNSDRNCPFPPWS